MTDKLSLWNKETEKFFFLKTLEIASPEQLFYKTEKEGLFLAYWPKDYKGKKSTLQSRNSFIGSFTEKWTRSLLSPIANKVGGYAVQNVICDSIGLTSRSPADVAICKTPDQIQKSQNILMIIEVKMSIVWNWVYDPETGNIICLGDYTTHQGNPSLLRSDTMLKAIGKSINIRVAGLDSSKIPIIIMGNTPIKESYIEKVDHLKTMGIIQGFFSINPTPLDTQDTKENFKSTPQKGFLRIDSFPELEEKIITLLKEDRVFFSGMKTKTQLGKLIEAANKKESYKEKAEEFLKLLRISYE